MPEAENTARAIRRKRSDGAGLVGGGGGIVVKGRIIARRRPTGRAKVDEVVDVVATLAQQPRAPSAAFCRDG